MKDLSDQYTVIIAKGEFPTHPLSLSCIQDANNIICLDGALKACLENNITPNAIIGDGDSISTELKEQYAHLLYIYTDQETNDLTKAIAFCNEKGIKNIKIVGATGKREDHTIGNISLLLEYMLFVNVEMITDYGIFTPIISAKNFDSFPGQQVSIFNIDNTPITSHNLKYPLKEYVLNNLWMGTLNESTSTNFTVETKGRTIVYRTHKAK
ncbi:MAG: thiamine diphosphokinase [Dysgonamonadaceae bacterium]|nr:thiamine diphosphokinase [Dysgonamonadaceae bacterium]